MATVMVRVNEKSHRVLRQIAKSEKASMTEVIDEAVEQLRRRKLLEGASADYAALKKDKKAWREELRERKAWDATLLDGLEDDE
jgi:hypothetical protein